MRYVGTDMNELPYIIFICYIFFSLDNNIREKDYALPSIS